MPQKRKLSVVQLIAATYCMVAGGPFGLEDIIRDAGYVGAVVILLLTPVVWSLPTALMVSELGSAIPEDGGYYAWVKRGLGRFWGFQEAWLSLAASIFDMAIYPTLFVLYLGRLVPELGTGWPAIAIGLGVIAVCAVWNMAGARSVGGSSVWLTAILMSPFLVIIAAALIRHPAEAVASAPAAHAGLLAGVMVAMWNYMGWDNASTIAGEVERPQRTYPLAMFGAVMLVALTYVIPVLAVSRSGIPAEGWTTGSWAEVGRTLAGPGLAVAVVIGGMASALGMLNALVLSYTRLPVALADDGFLPKIFTKRNARNGAPWVAILACAALWAASLGIGFERLIALDIMLYGLSLTLEFVALVALRIREPAMPRPYRVPFGLVGAVAVGIGPMTLMVIALWQSRSDRFGPVSALVFGLGVIALGVLVYFISPGSRKKAAE